MTEERRGLHPFFVYGGIVVAAFAAGIVIFHFILLPIIFGRADIVIVPDTRGMPLPVAEEACRQRNLNLIVVGERYSETVPAGYVLEQDPAPSEGLKGGRTIRVVTSSGVRLERVPDMIGGTLREAELAVENARLRRGRVARVFRPGEGQNLVAAINPPAGSMAPNGSPVDFLVHMSGEPRLYLMPDLVGKDLQFVRERLERGGFHVSRVVTRRDERRFPGTILSQIPPAGHSIREGAAIELVVSTVD